MGELAKVILTRNDLNGASIKQCCFRTECSKQPGGRCNIFFKMMRFHNMLTQPPKHPGDKRKKNDPTDEQLAQREVEKDAIKAKRRETQCCAHVRGRCTRALPSSSAGRSRASFRPQWNSR